MRDPMRAGDDNAVSKAREWIAQHGWDQGSYHAHTSGYVAYFKVLFFTLPCDSHRTAVRSERCSSRELGMPSVCFDKTYVSLLQNSPKRRDESKALRDLAMGKTENHKILPARLRAMNRMDCKRLFKRTYSSHSIVPVRPACVCLESLAQRLNSHLVGNEMD